MSVKFVVDTPKGENKTEWEALIAGEEGLVRARVDGGYVYRTYARDSSGSVSVALTFAPDNYETVGYRKELAGNKDKAKS